MFDAQGRIILRNHHYLEMYKLHGNIVRPGCTLRELIQHRKDTGIFKGDVTNTAGKFWTAFAKER